MQKQKRHNINLKTLLREQIMNEKINTQKKESAESEVDKNHDSDGRDSTISFSSNQANTCSWHRIQQHYNYWEQFIFYWLNDLPIINLGWHNPNDIPLLNSLYRNNGPGPDYSSYYLPEPWWGWSNDKSKPLHSVVINFNPGGGGRLQERWSIKQVYDGSYACDIVNNPKVLPQTRKWHNNNRAVPILNALGLQSTKNNSQIENHVSIELLPWHTASASNNPGYWFYLEQNIKEVYNHCISFAAELSRIIDKPTLNRVVILRMNEEVANRIIDLLKTIDVNVMNKTQINTNLSNGGRYFCFKISTFPDVLFASIWGTHSRNGFPQSDLKKIFENFKFLKF